MPNQLVLVRSFQGETGIWSHPDLYHSRRDKLFNIPPIHNIGAFDYPSYFFGTVGNASIYHDATLGSPGKLLAKQLYNRLPSIVAKCEADFGEATLPFNVIVANLEDSHNGYGGAYHYGCDFETGGTLYVDAAFGDPARVIGLVVAELTECQMGQQAKGWNCGGSNGEALSRFLAELRSGGPAGALTPYASAPDWDKAGRPNWIDTTEPTDTNPISTGCGLVYLYWMLSIGFTETQIVQAGGATLAMNYMGVTGRSEARAWSDFSAAFTRLSAITSDDPWRRS